MAKVTQLPGMEIISGFKGVVDYYVYMGVPCARKWPSSPGHKRAPAVEAAWPAFSWSASNWNNLSQPVRDAYNRLAANTGMTGRDIFTKSFINGSTLYLEGV